MKSLGIVSKAEDVTYLEIQVFGILESELQKFNEAQNEKELKKREIKHGRKPNIRN